VRCFAERALAIAIVFVMILSSAAALEPVRGRSRDLNIDFEASGGAKWCAPAVVVRLDAPQPSRFDLDHAAFVLMIGRIKSIVLDQCFSAELITFEGRAKGAAAFAMEISRLTKWRRLTRLDPPTRKPLCDGVQPRGADCDRRIAAYATAKQMMRGPAFSEVEIVTLLDTGVADHLVWKANNIVGKLQLSHRGELGGTFDNGSLADAIAAQTGAACSASGGRAGAPTSATYEKNLAYRGLACQAAGGAVVQNVILVASENDWFYIFSLWSDDANHEHVSAAASRLVKGIGMIRADRAR
jgi:hypothetical protein